jgi:S-adenosylmethionine decarboxylase
MKPHKRVSATIGCEWIVDVFDCIPQRLRELSTLKGLCDSIVYDLQLGVIGKPQWHLFPGEGGVTGLYLLSESHLACHTYPEFGMATFNLVCCRELAEWPFEKKFQEVLGAVYYESMFLPRGLRSEVRVRSERCAETWSGAHHSQLPRESMP